MTLVDPRRPLSSEHRNALARSVKLLESTSVAKRLTDYASQPVNKALKKIPGPLSRKLDKAVETAILRCLRIAIRSLDAEATRPPKSKVSSLLAGVTGGLGGMFGATSLPVELPVTTILMLRAIADIARHSGEDMTTLEARLACVEVFALGARTSQNRTDFGYYASRALLTRLSGDATTFFVERTVTGASAPVANRLAAEIAARFGLAISERAAASALPVVGALGGAAVNVIFMKHFQDIARGHFAIRHLERVYDADTVRQEYTILAGEFVAAKRVNKQK
jgi:hypothetical protein